VFQNKEKKREFIRDSIGYSDTELITLFGAIDLNRFLEVLPADRSSSKDELVVLKHCTPDWRKYITKESEGSGEKIHVWQKHVIKERDVKFYSRLLHDIKNVRFEFMEAHSELVRAFEGNDRMVFHKWDSMPVTEFLARGHVYLYRTSNKWRDQYPRVVAEALASGLPVLTEPRDGTRDRVDNGNTGIHCIDYDMFLDGLKKLSRKERMRKAMGENAKDWARMNLDPRRWVDEIERVFLHGSKEIHRTG
jgi:glycosyltransferase involved in cell wall biosynthesis